MLHFQRSTPEASDTTANYPLVIVHGLFGAIDNWNGQIKQLAKQFDVIAIDLRNHGKSPHIPGMTYLDMARDLAELFDHLDIETCHLLGHSMGGKCAMQFALTYPDKIKSLLIADIAPVKYGNRHQDVFAGLNAVPLSEIRSRKDADGYLAQHIDDMGVRAFLLKNLVRVDAGYGWRMSLKDIEAGYDEICDAPKLTENGPFNGPTLFLKGGQSDYIKPAYKDAVTELFSQVNMRIIEDAGHWLHAQKPDAFNRIVQRFCLSHDA